MDNWKWQYKPEQLIYYSQLEYRAIKISLTTLKFQLVSYKIILRFLRESVAHKFQKWDQITIQTAHSKIIKNKLLFSTLFLIKHKNLQELRETHKIAPQHVNQFNSSNLISLILYKWKQNTANNADTTNNYETRVMIRRKR